MLSNPGRGGVHTRPVRGHRLCVGVRVCGCCPPSVLLSENEIGAEGGKALGEALKVNGKLSQLDLAGMLSGLRLGTCFVRHLFWVVIHLF